MPFLKLDNNWSKLAPLYNQAFSNKPEPPAIKYVGFDDGLVRGGVINAGISTVRDTLRIGKFLASSKGAMFITKQVGLQLSNPLLEQHVNINSLNSKSSSGFLNKGINSAITFVNNFANKNGSTRVYNLGINTLSQIPFSSMGEHIVRHGLLPSFKSAYNYEEVVIKNNKEQYNIGFDFSDNLKIQTNPNRLVDYLRKIALSTEKNITLQEYSGGPQSTYGIGNTTINTTSIRTTVLKNDNKKVNNGFKPLTNVELLKSTMSNLVSPLAFQLQQSPLQHNKNISGYNIESRVGVSISSSSTPLSRKVDSINTISIMNSSVFYGLSEGGTQLNATLSEPNAFTYTSGSNLFSSGSLKNPDGYFGRDIIKFRIEFLDNDVPDDTTLLAFRAYIDDFQDGMSAKWNPYRYMGRGEDFYVYDGFTRDISVSFTIYAHSPEEMKPLYQKLNYLMSSFAPDYSDKNKMRGNIAYLTVGDYLYKQPGVFTDIKLSGMLDTHWEIALNDPENGSDKNQYEVPKHIKVSLSFKPIHDFLPRRVSNKVKMIDVPFVTPNRNTKTGITNKYLS